MATDTITALGAGSGVDVKSLATSLVEVERAPAKAVIDKKVTASKNSVSGYAAIKYVLDNLKTAFADLKDQSDFASMAPSNSQPSALSVAAGATTAAGSHTVTVTTLASAQRSISDGAGFLAAKRFYESKPFELTLIVGSDVAKTIAVSEDTPAGIAAAINSANLGITANLVKTSNVSTPSYKIMVTGTTGASNNFTLTAPAGVADLVFGNASPLPTARDAELNVDGVAITSSSNQVQGAITGATLNLTGTTSGAATLNFARDTSGVKAKLQALVTAYNDANSMLGVVSDSQSTVTTYGATLVGNSIVSQVRNQIRNLVLGESTSTSGSVKALRDLGISIDKAGVLTLDATKLDSALNDHFDNAVTMLSANTENISSYSTQAAGLAGEAVRKLTAMLASTGSISTQSANATKKISDYNADLAKLETRMKALLARYTKQFAAMDSIVGQTNSLRTSLTSTFDGMMSMYTKK